MGRTWGDNIPVDPFKRKRGRSKRLAIVAGTLGLSLLLTACPSETSDPGGGGDLRECLEDNKGVNC